MSYSSHKFWQMQFDFYQLLDGVQPLEESHRTETMII